MTEQSDYRKYLESEFMHLNEKIDNIHDDVKETKAQVKITNGRVTELEKINAKYRLECLEKNLEDVTFFARHPKVFIGIIVLLTSAVLATGFFNYIK